MSQKHPVVCPFPHEYETNSGSAPEDMTSESVNHLVRVGAPSAGALLYMTALFNTAAPCRWRGGTAALLQLGKISMPFKRWMNEWRNEGMKEGIILKIFSYIMIMKKNIYKYIYLFLICKTSHLHSLPSVDVKDTQWGTQWDVSSKGLHICHS